MPYNIFSRTQQPSSQTSSQAQSQQNSPHPSSVDHYQPMSPRVPRSSTASVSSTSQSSNKEDEDINLEYLRKKAEADLLEERELLEKRVSERTAKIKEDEEYLNSIVQTVRESLIVLNNDFTVQSANQFFYKTFQLTAEDVEGKRFFEVGNGIWNVEELEYLLKNVLPHNNPFEGFEIE